MKIKLATLLLTVAAMAGLAIVPTAKASEMDKKTIINISGAPIEIAGRVLSPGQYVIKRVDRDIPDVIGVYSANERHLLVTTKTIPVEEAQRTGKVVLGMEETPKGSPEALKTWVYPGDSIGEEFIAPNGMAIRVQARPGATLSMAEPNSSLKHREKAEQKMNTSQIYTEESPAAAYAE